MENPELNILRMHVQIPCSCALYFFEIVALPAQERVLLEKMTNDHPLDVSFAGQDSSASESDRPRQQPTSRYMAVEAQTIHLNQDMTHSLPLLIRVSITDYRGNALMDTTVRPTRNVSEVQLFQIGFTPADFLGAPTYHQARSRVASLIRDRIIVGYALWKFLAALGLNHPAIDTRDVALFLPFRRALGSKSMLPLSVLVHHLMGRNIGLGTEIPLEIARASLDLFRSCEDVWEGIVASGYWACALPPVAYAAYFS